MRITRLFLCVFAVSVISTIAAIAAVPPMISYQGKLMQPNGTPVPDSTYSIRFAIYDAPTEGNTLWSETNPGVQVKGGLFGVMLGSVVNLPANIFDGASRFFGIKIGSDPEMTPRQQVASVAFAVKAASADTAATATTVSDVAITTSKIADGAVTANKLADGSVNATKIADASVTTAKVQDGAVTAAKLSTSAIALGLSKLEGFFSTDSTSCVPVTGLTTTVTIPAGGRLIRISAWARSLELTNTHTSAECSIWDGPVGTGTMLTKCYLNGGGSPRDGYLAAPLYVSYVGIQSLGSHTYNVGLLSRDGPPYWVQISGDANCPAYLLVEAL